MAEHLNEIYKGQGTERCGMTCQEGESSMEQNMRYERSGKDTRPGHNNNACKKVHRKRIDSYHRQLSCEEQLKKTFKEYSMAEHLSEIYKGQGTERCGMTCQKGESSMEQNMCYGRSDKDTCSGHNNNDKNQRSEQMNKMNNYDQNEHRCNRVPH